MEEVKECDAVMGKGRGVEGFIVSNVSFLFDLGSSWILNEMGIYRAANGDCGCQKAWWSGQFSSDEDPVYHDAAADTDWCFIKHLAHAEHLFAFPL